MKEITFSSDKNLVNYDEVSELYESVGFGSSHVYKEDLEYEKSFMSEQVYGFFAFSPSGKLVGMLRIFSDNKICSWIAEICVHPKYQKNGIGSHLMGMLNEHFGHTAVYVNALAGSEGFFEKHGIKPKEKLISCSRAGTPSQDKPFIH